MRFINVEYCLIVFKFFAIFFPCWKKIWPCVLLLLMWHTASWNKIYLFDLSFENRWDQYLIGILIQQRPTGKPRLTNYCGKYLFTYFFYNKNSSDRKRKRPQQLSSTAEAFVGISIGGVVCSVVTLRHVCLQFGLVERTGLFHALELASPSPLLRRRLVAG